MEVLEKKVERFISLFSERLNNIRSTRFVESPQDNCLYKKIIYVALIDSLSGTVYPKRGSRARVVSFIRNFSGWKFCQKISLPHLVRLLEKVSEPKFPKLRQFAFSSFDKWKEGDVIELDKDPDYTKVQQLLLADKQSTESIGKVKLISLRHDHLFYEYRNKLVHELIEPGYGMEHDEDKEPLYHIMTTMHSNKSETTSWELVYPLGFFESICKTILEKLEKYYTTNQIDPYQVTKKRFGTYWLKELNR